MIFDDMFKHDCRPGAHKWLCVQDPSTLKDDDRCQCGAFAWRDRADAGTVIVIRRFGRKSNGESEK